MDNKLEAKIDKLDERLDSIERILIRQDEQLPNIIRRTKDLEDAIKPVVAHVAHVEGGIKLIGIVSVIGGLIIGILKCLR